MKISFKPGYCAHCGAQAMVTDTAGRPIKALLGSKSIWLCLCDEAGKIKTRVGTVNLCKDCEVGTASAEDIKDNLINSRLSGVGELMPEIGMYPNLKLELIKRYGE